MMEKSSKQSKQLERLRKIRSRGRGHFILWYGVLVWGVSTAVLSSLLMGWLKTDRTFFDYAPTAFVIFPIAGVFWGASMWWWSMRLLRKRGVDDPA